MKLFHCDKCGSAVFFENDHCLKCGNVLGFVPEILDLATFKAAGENFLCLSPASKRQKSYRFCVNRKEHQICNWMLPVEDANPLCRACRLSETIPDLSVAENKERWHKLEAAKRRCLYTLLRLELPIDSTATANYPSLRFRFLADSAAGVPVKTGYGAGIITLNVAEADDDERERRKHNLHEPYRTLVGHFRHELGHYYWEILVANTSALRPFRELFGDETVDYAAALKNYYEQGPAADWPSRTVTAYASAHPWEDWAETWAHYMHIVDTFETATAFGMSLLPEEPSALSMTTLAFQKKSRPDFDDLLEQWFPLTCALNSINRGMGLPDLYPFVISQPAIEKMRFIHKLIRHPADDVKNSSDKTAERPLMMQGAAA